MIQPKEIYERTNNGLNIIFILFPSARGCEDGKKKFRLRPEEKTPSAVLYKCQNKKDGYTVYKVVDFGDEGRALDPIDLYMQQRGISRYTEALAAICQEFGIEQTLSRAVNKPRLEERDARPDEQEGTRPFQLKERISDNALKVLGPRVTQEVAASLNWYEAEWVGFVKNRRVKLRYSTDTFPILLRECVVRDKEGEPTSKFYKLYEPLNPDKGFRFSYLPKGGKPQRYVNGLEELRQRYEQYNREEEQQFYANPEHEGWPFRGKKIEEAFICSGERDALCVRSLGYFPLWFNSETYRVSPEEIKEIYKYVDTLYNIPDIDQTGRKKGTELALRFWDIHTIWLPEWLTNYHDNRGRPRKDLRDWQELRTEPQDFRSLMELAMPSRFWFSRIQNGREVYEIDTDCLLNFLTLHGFHTLHDEDADDVHFVRIQNGVVETVRTKDIRRFVREWSLNEALPRAVRNLIMNTTRLSDATLHNLQEVNPTFASATAESQLFFFENTMVKVTPEQIDAYPDGLKGVSAWRENVVPHRFEPLPDFFTITRDKLMRGGQVAAQFDITLSPDTSSCLFDFVINSSRVHWRKELEEQFLGKPEEEKRAYRQTHRFCIDGRGLNGEEIFEQKQNLINKIFAIGYLLHRYKSPSRAWAPIAMDNKIGTDGECNGRSGKSFLFKALQLFMKTVTLSGRNGRLLENDHCFEQVTRWTDFVLVDDCQKNLTTENFYDLITGSMTVNPKNNHIYTLPFQDSPKFGFTTNYVPRDFDASTEARLIYMVFSDYYHQQTAEGDYLESRSIRDDFQHDLFSETYTPEQWNADINFCLQCVRFYLSVAREGLKLQPPMGNIMQRKWKADMGENFEQWASGYFSREGEHVNTFVVRRAAYEDFIDEAKVNKNFYTMNRFTKALRSFVSLTPYAICLNPPELANAGGRILKRVGERTEDMIYLRTIDDKPEGQKDTLPF